MALRTEIDEHLARLSEGTATANSKWLADCHRTRGHHGGVGLTLFFADLRSTLIPVRGSKDGPLPLLLVALTFVTGLVDAFSYLVLGHVFVANMTGNVVFLGFALVGASGFSAGASSAALASFVVGALVGGRIGYRFQSNRGHMLGSAATLQAIFVSVAVALATANGPHLSTGARYVLIVMLASAMGVQNAVARRLAVPELTTTVLTMTMTGLGADGVLARGAGSKAGRRLVAIAAMFLGAITGAVSVLDVRIEIPLAIADLVLIAVAVTAVVLGRRDPAWSTV
jgi:uncharacterized membrane protein YoaK (UPF0700 family)